MTRFDVLRLRCAGALRHCATAMAAVTLGMALMPAAVIALPVEEGPIETDPTTQAVEKQLPPLYWSSHGHPKEAAYELLFALEKSPSHGIPPSRYAISKLYETLEQTPTPENLRYLDDLFTTALWTYTNDLINGNALLRTSKMEARTQPLPSIEVSNDLYRKMIEALRQDGLAHFIKQVQPNLPEYLELQAALERYRELELLGGWPQLPRDTWLKPKMQDKRVSLLRERLGIIDPDIGSPAGHPHVFDDELMAGVIRFQRRHGLTADGEVGPVTLATLNVTATEKVRRIALNLNRLRQLPEVMPKDYIRVNIAEYDLQLVRDGNETLRMPVIVGSRDKPTPSMANKVRHLVFNPYWYPPHNISVQEILPRLKREPEYLERLGFDVLRGKTVVDASEINWQDYSWRSFPFRFRQRPGENNSLGRVKFIFPNSEAVYLHDTPKRALFEEPLRARSHGCVRLAKPLELATALMDWDRGWSDEDVQEDIDKAKRKLRKFKTRMDIYLLYLTTRVDGATVRFLPDIYRHDRIQAQWQKPAPALTRYLDPVRPGTATLASR